MRGSLRTTAALGALTMLALAGCASGPGGQPEPTTAWEAREHLSAYLVETADAVGLEGAEQRDTSAEPFECERLAKADGTGTAFELVEVEGEPGGDAAEVLAAIAEHWSDDGYEVAESTGMVRAGNPDDGELRALQVPGGGAVLLHGTTPCMDEGGGPEG